MEVFSALAPARPTIVYDTYWRLAAERQSIFFRRFRNEPPPWTGDCILREHKFTNAYRASDRTSQYLIRNVIYAGDRSPVETCFRVLLFKLFNKIETWQYLMSGVGEVTYSEYSYQRYNQLLLRAIANGQRIYSAAYIMPPGSREFGLARKHSNHLRLLESMMESSLPDRIVAAHGMHEVVKMLLSYPSIGDFLAYQLATDLNYSELTDFSEMTFVLPGPGARDGIRKCFADCGGLNDAEIIRLVADRQEVEFGRLGIAFQSLWGRRLQLIDCQNLFCEVDKYARVAHPEYVGRSGRTRIKQRFRPSMRALDLWYPPKWGINDAVMADMPCRAH